MEKKKRIFSGIQPSGLLHIGNYLGAIKNWGEYQGPGYESIFCIVDLHAITVPQDPEALKKNILELTKVYIASGIDPKKSTLFIQSDRPEHAEMGWILSCFTPYGELSRMTQFKEKGEGKKEVTAGLFSYPTLMAADILLYETDIVPVGEDQKQHIELTRNIAERFNHKYGQTFVIPEPDIRKEGARIMGLDNPLSKMSKSAASEANWIALRDPADVIRRKIQKAVTDTGSEIIFDKVKKPAISNLLNIYALFADENVETVVNRYSQKTYSDFKNDLADVVISGLAPLQESLAELDSDPGYVAKVLAEGSQKAAPIASATLTRVKEKIGLG